MDFKRINRSEIVGCTKSKTAVVEALVRNNALNRTGCINYNVGGVKDNVGFVNVTEKFVDNFLLHVLVPDYNTKNGKNIFVGSQNRTIRELLDAHGLEKCNVKAVAFIKVKDVPCPLMLEKMPLRDLEKTVDTYYLQEYKVACPNVDYSIVMDFIRSMSYNMIGMFLKDIDISMDYSGSFDKYEVVECLISNEGFKLAGTSGDADRIIVDNDSRVGRNCLTFMEAIDGFTMRQKIYNKMVQILESKSVRSTVGCHWKDWVCQTDTRLADARDKARDRGLTRAEVTFYIESLIPSDVFIDGVLQGITRYVPKSFVYSTTYSATWKAYCDAFLHSLVCIDRTADVGIVVYGFNEITGKISGQLYERWGRQEKWCLDKITLNGNLPLDVIESVEVSKEFLGKRKDIILEISGTRYFKVHPDNSTRFPTRIVSKGGVYSYNRGTLEKNASLLEKCGIVEHENCIPYLAKSKGTNTSKADAELRKVDVLHVNLPSDQTAKDRVLVELKDQLIDQAKNIEMIRKPLLLDLKKKELTFKQIKGYKEDFRGCGTLPIAALEQGAYKVHVAKKLDTRFGVSYKLLVEVENNNHAVWSNKSIRDVLEDAQEKNLVRMDGAIIYLNDQPLGDLKITGRGTNRYGNVSVYSTFILNSVGKIEELLPPNALDPVSTDIPTIPRENLLPYREYANLITFPIDSVLQVEATGYIEHYGIQRLVVKVKGDIYQAGQDLEEKIHQFTAGCSIKIERVRLNCSRRIKYAICSIYEDGDWTCMVDYAKTPMLSKFDKTTCVLDVRTVEVKGLKRKLLLTDAGDVFKLKKSKLEESVTPGFI